MHKRCVIWLSTSYLGGEGLASADTDAPPTSKDEDRTRQHRILYSIFDIAVAVGAVVGRVVLIFFRSKDACIE